MGALLGIMGDGTENNGVFINEGTVNDEGDIESTNAKWTNSGGTFNKNRGQFALVGNSKFTNTQSAILNIIGGGTDSTAAILGAQDSDIVNTLNSEINIQAHGSLYDSRGPFFRK